MKPLFVSYQEFGAVGDGVTDDIDAIVACHKYANENGVPVRLTDDKCYYIGGKKRKRYHKDRR